MADPKVTPMDMLQSVPPGISWTAEDQGRPWLRPPKFTNLSDVAQTYIDRLADPQTINDLLDALETEVPLATLAEAIMLNGVGAGLHTLDAGILVMPVIMEMMKTVAVFHDIKTTDFAADLDAKTKIHPRVAREALLKSMEQIKTGTPEETPEGLAPSGGLMAKPTMEENNGL